MEPRIDTIDEKKLVGKRMKMSLSNNQTGALWQSFMPKRKEIKGAVGKELYSMQIYDASYFQISILILNLKNGRQSKSISLIEFLTEWKHLH
jgi:predicted transcriptional regulator YdeE